jgi:hypothetical protein
MAHILILRIMSTFRFYFHSVFCINSLVIYLYFLFIKGFRKAQAFGLAESIKVVLGE